jgi:uncharacterized phage-associated protein
VVIGSGAGDASPNRDRSGLESEGLETWYTLQDRRTKTGSLPSVPGADRCRKRSDGPGSGFPWNVSGPVGPNHGKRGAMYDPRAIANLILDEGQRSGRPVTNLALQKLLYFAHALYLIERKEPLVSGFFEAWQYGPVHPTVYDCFKSAGDQPVTFRAGAVNVMTGERKELPPPKDPEVVQHIVRVMALYGRLTPGRLVEISHARGAPWDFVVDKARNSVALGLRITDEVMLDRFKFHKVSVAEVPKVGEPGEDTPFVA